eukprot:10089768-Prorocentrum_lima.AAC.1
MPLSQSWEDVPHGVLPLIKNGSEVHLKQAFHRRRVAMREPSRAHYNSVRLQAAARRKAGRRQYLVDLADHKEQALSLIHI